METKTDISYGVIPYIDTENGPKFLLVYQFSMVRGDTYWVFPKGHVEEGESPEETARRELREETGVTLSSLDTSREFVQEYSYEQDRVHVEKKAIFFLGKAASTDFLPDQKEVKDGGWFTYEAARERLSYESTKQVLEDAMQYLEN